MANEWPDFEAEYKKKQKAKKKKANDFVVSDSGDDSDASKAKQPKKQCEDVLLFPSIQLT